MPTTKSGWKRMRTSAKSRTMNRDVKGRIMTSRKALDGFFASGSVEDYDKGLREFFSILDKAAKKGIIKKNTADRRKANAIRKRARIQKAPAKA